MRSIHKYHGFPPALTDMLCNMGTGRKGRVPTANGAGTEWDMECGLGQGSVLVNGIRILTYTGYKTDLTYYFGKYVFAIFVYLGIH
jgi:hypothetical protein